MNIEDKLLNIIEGLQDSIRKLESERITVNDPFHQDYPYTWKWAYPVGCMCSECHIPTFRFPYNTNTGTDLFKIGDNIDEIS